MLDETGKQLCVVLATSCTKRDAKRWAQYVVDRVNADERGKSFTARPSNWFDGGYLGNGHCSFMQAMNGAHYFCCLSHEHDGPHRTDSQSAKDAK